MNRAAFILAFGIATRLLIAALVLTAGASHAPFRPDWDAFGHWDGGFFRAIVVSGYEYHRDGAQHNVVFFPLFPLLVTLVMRATGASFVAAALAINTIAFLAALFIVYDWIEARNGRSAARWAVVILCICPLSLFETVAYSESTFLLLTAGALRAYDAKRYLTAGVCAALASASRFLGAALCPAFAVTAFVHKQGPRAIAAAVVAPMGVLAYAIYEQLRFGDPFAFLRAESGWRGGLGFRPDQWATVLVPAVTGVNGVAQAGIIAVAIVFARRITTMRLPVAVAVAMLLLVAEALLITPNDLERLILIGGGAWALVQFRAQLGTTSVSYAVVSLAVILFSGSLISIERLAFDVVPIVAALAVAFSILPALGTAVALYWFPLLGIAARAFALGLWVA